ncbi:HEPN domain-containing protein [Candidatus Parcubacteria bacterium]|nr:HEPN domain-containing protein [Candidatus Parcubacteria bacterium]
MGHIYSQGEQAKKSLQWVSWADNDYIAARQLLLADALVQGSGLSNTAIEKYLKALFVLLGLDIPKGFKGHNVCSLYNKIKEKGLTLGINEEYLALLFRSYRLRYPDDLELGFNIALNRTKLIVELDRTVYEIREGFNFKNVDKKITTKIDQFKKEKNPILLNKNCYFGEYNRIKLFEENCFYYELRVLEKDTIMEASYFTTGIDDNGEFNLVGLKQTNFK